MNKTQLIGIGIAIIAVLAFFVIGLEIGKSRSSTGAATQGFSSQEEMMAAHHPSQATSANAARTDGFKSEAEMMAAHHPNQAGAASGSNGCGGVAASTGQKASFAGQKSDYGVTYDDAGYQQLVGYAKSVQLNSAQTQLIVGLDAQIPCCGFKLLQASGNCECGHHQALFGVAKLLASKGYSRDQIQSEMNKWKEVFYPDGSSSGTGGCA